MFKFLARDSKQSLWLTMTVFILMGQLLSGCGGGGSGGSGDGEDADVSDIPVTTNDYLFSLEPDQVVSGGAASAPAQAGASLQTQARGTVEIFATGTVDFTDFNATSVGIYAGFAGEAGSLMLELEKVSANRWAIPNNTELDDGALYRLQNSGFYLLAESSSGKLRGQILPEGWSLTMFVLSGDHVVPPLTTPATAIGGLTVEENSTSGRYDYHLRITTTNLTNTTSASLRENFAGANGDVVFNLEQSATNSNTWGSGDINDINFVPFFSGSGLERLLSGGYYVSIATVSAPEGEIRGQLLPAGVQTFTTTLSAGEVVSATPITTSGTARAITTYREGSGEIAINVWTQDIDPVSVALHEGAYGQNGPMLYGLIQSGFDSPLWSLSLTQLSPQEITALQTQSLYLSILTNTFPEGELRGQIMLDDNAPNTSITLTGNDGKLILTDPAGSRFELDLSSNALLEEATLTMARTELPDIFPEGIRPLSAVQLGPDGTTFSAAPVITINGDSVASTGGARAGYLINSNGVIEYTPLLGDDMVAAAMGKDSGSFDVLHFSDAGIIEVDPAILERIPPPSSLLSAEAQARQKLADLLVHTGNVQIMGGDLPLDLNEVDSIFSDWSDDIIQRANLLSPTTLNSFSDFTEELLRYNVLGLKLGQQIFGARFSDTLYTELSNHLTELDNICLGGETAIYYRFLIWLDVANAYFGQIGEFPDESAKLVPQCLFSVELSTKQTLFAVEGAQEPEVSVTLFGADGGDITHTVAPSLLGINWYIEEGLARTEDNSVLFNTEDIGLKEASLRFNYHTVDEEATAVVVPEHRGSRQILAFGSASNCPDPEDNGELFGGQVVPITINSLTLAPISNNSVNVILSGSGGAGGVTVGPLTINITYDQFTETSVSGDATGSITYTSTELDEDTGEPTTVTGTLNLGTGTATDIVDFPNVTGTDSLGCQLSGNLTVGQISP